MKRVLFVNLIILLFFAGMSYWTEKKEKLETAAEEKRLESGPPAVLSQEQTGGKETEEKETTKKDYIHWVDFQVSKFAMSEAYEYDRDSYGTKAHISWIDLLAYAAAYTGGNFDNDQTVCKYMDALKEEIGKGEKLEKLTEDLEYFSYYKEAYTAVLGGMVGEFEREEPGEGGAKDAKWVKQYGLKAYHPIAKGFPYSDYDDFGASRSYGYKRNHLGHDMMGQIGTPICIITRTV